MKKIFLLLFVSVFILSCNNDETNFDRIINSDSGWLEITSATTEYKTPFSTFTTEVPVALGVGNNEKGQVITYSIKQISGLPVAGLQTGTFKYNFKSGDVFAKIPVEFKNAASYSIEVTLLSTSNPDYTVGLSDNTKRVSHIITVCGSIPLAASYKASSEIATNAGVEVTAFDLAPVLVPGTTNQYTVDSAWGPNFVAGATGNAGLNGRFPYPATITVNDDLTVTIAGLAFYAAGGKGTFDPCTNSITYELEQTLFTNPFKVNVTAKLP